MTVAERRRALFLREELPLKPQTCMEPAMLSRQVMRKFGGAVLRSQAQQALQARPDNVIASIKHGALQNR